MAITNFRPQVWSATLLSVLYKNLAYANALTVNRDYEGEISSMGDTVKITSIADPSIVDYTKDTDLTVETLTDDQQSLTITQAKAFAFEVDDIDMRQARNGGALMTEAAQRSGFGLRDQADQFMRDQMWRGAQAANALGVIDASTTAAKVYDEIFVPLSVTLDEANVPSEGRWAVATPAVYGKLLLDDRFIKANEAGTAALHTAMVGDAAGFVIFKSNNGASPSRSVTITNTVGSKDLVSATAAFSQMDVGRALTGTNIPSGATVASVSADGKTLTMSAVSATTAPTSVTIAAAGTVTAGSRIAATYAEQINKVEAFRPEKRFADALKGLHLYGGKVVRPEALAVASVKLS